MIPRQLSTRSPSREGLDAEIAATLSYLAAYVSYSEDALQIRTGSGRQVMATLRNLAIGSENDRPPQHRCRLPLPRPGRYPYPQHHGLKAYRATMMP